MIRIYINGRKRQQLVRASTKPTGTQEATLDTILSQKSPKRQKRRGLTALLLVASLATYSAQKQILTDYTPINVSQTAVYTTIYPETIHQVPYKN